MTKPVGHAVIIGGSVAGLCAARVLADFFEQVTVLERDKYPTDARDRPGVPHGRQFHGLRERGLTELENLFPGFRSMMQNRGAGLLEVGVNYALLTPNGWVPPRRNFRTSNVQASRPLIDASIRDLCGRISNIAISQRTLVTGLSISATRPSQCDGVVTSDGNRVNPDLVVDATGVSSRTPEWLSAIGVIPPEETIVDAFVGYAGVWLRLREGARWPDDWWWTGGASVSPLPPIEGRTLILTRHENDRWLLTVAGRDHDYPPQDFEGLLAIASAARSPVVSRMLELMEPVSRVRGYRPAGNRWRHYEQWRTPLTNFIVVGDAFCSYNPTNGLGLSAAAVTAQVLSDHLRQFGPYGFSLSKSFHQEQARVQRGLWQVAVGNDFRFPKTQGRRTMRIRLITWYRDLAMRTISDPVVRQRVQSVADMMVPLSALWAPSVVWRVLRSEVKRFHRQRGNQQREIPPMPPPMPTLS